MRLFLSCTNRRYGWRPFAIPAIETIRCDRSVSNLGHGVPRTPLLLEKKNRGELLWTPRKSRKPRSVAVPSTIARRPPVS
jgi:hypothetical protein